MPKLRGIMLYLTNQNIKTPIKSLDLIKEPFEDCKLQVAIALLSFHCMLFVFALFLKGLFAFLPFVFRLFVCFSSWLQLPSGITVIWGGGGGRHACSHSFGVFSCLLEIHGNLLSCQKYGFCLKAKQKTKKPRLKFFWCGNLSESLFGHTAHMQKPHMYSFVLGRSLCMCKRHRAKKVFF